MEYVEPYYKAADNSGVDELYDISIGQSRENVKEVFGNIDQFNGKYARGGGGGGGKLPYMGYIGMCRGIGYGF